MVARGWTAVPCTFPTIKNKIRFRKYVGWLGSRVTRGPFHKNFITSGFHNGVKKPKKACCQKSNKMPTFKARELDEFHKGRFWWLILARISQFFWQHILSNFVAIFWRFYCPICVMKLKSKNTALFGIMWYKFGR